MALRDIRKTRRLTQMQLATLSGVEQTVISLLERKADPNPTWYTARALKRALRVRYEDLFRETPPREAQP